MENEYEIKKRARRENRLKNIVSELKNLLKDTLPEEAENFEITYEEIRKRKDSIFGGTTDVLYSQSPACGIFLKQKSHPKRKYEIMHLFRQDIDKYVKKDNIRSEYQVPSYKENLSDAIKSKKKYKQR